MVTYSKSRTSRSSATTKVWSCLEWGRTRSLYCQQWTERYNLSPRRTSGFHKQLVDSFKASWIKRQLQERRGIYSLNLLSCNRRQDWQGLVLPHLQMSRHPGALCQLRHQWSAQLHQELVCSKCWQESCLVQSWTWSNQNKERFRTKITAQLQIES